MPDRAPRGGAFPVDATLRGSRRTRAMRVFRVASSSRGWNLARRGGHRRRRRDDSRVRPRHRSMPPRDGGPTGNHRGGTRGSSARRVDVSPPAGNHVRRRVGRTGGGGAATTEACWCGPTRSTTSPTTKGTRTKTTKTTKTAETTVPSERVPTRRARWRRWFVNSPARAGSVGRRSDPELKAKAKAKASSASASASWSQSRSRSRSRSLARRRRRRPAAYRRWWPHSDAVTGVVARGGRVVSVSEDGGCHVLPLPEDVLARAHAHLAAENRAWAARASAAARSEARTEEHAHESLEASASWARTRAGGSAVRVRRRRASAALLGVHVRGVPVHEPGVARGERRRGGGGGGVVARGRSAQRRRRLRRRRRHVRRHARRGSRVDHGRSTGGVRGVRGGFHGGGDGGGCGEIRTRSRESGGGENRRTRRTIRAVARAHFPGNTTPRRGASPRIGRRSSRGTRTGTSSRGISARRKSRDSSGGEQDHAREGCVWVGGTRVAKR